MNLIYLYLAGIFFIGVPMAKLSLWFYKTGTNLEKFPKGKKFFLMSVRNLLLPYFVFERGGWLSVNYPHKYRDSQPEIMTSIVEVEFFESIDRLDSAECLTYIIISSMLWPVRVVWNCFVLGVALVMSILSLPFLVPDLLTMGIRLLTRPAHH